MYVMLLAIMIFISAALSGLFAPPFPVGTEEKSAQEEYTCCDTGDKAECKARTDKPAIHFKGKEYRLLKSDIYLHDYADNLEAEHLNPVNPEVRRGDNQRVFENPTQSRAFPRTHFPECTAGRSGQDQLFGQPDPRNVDNPKKPGCYLIPDDMLIYLCRNDSPGSCNGRETKWDSVKFDVYIRMEDIRPGGRPGRIPDVISNCYKPPPPKSTEKQIEFKISPGGQKNLQLRTFNFIVGAEPTTWLSPYCKPAIYLYPERKSEVNVSVFPQGEMLLTIPPYPKNGWDVVAEPNGDIYFGQERFDYLYYEAALPDASIQKPKEGYIMAYEERSLFLTDLVTRLGLNEKETKQFVEYWVPILPESPYYFVGIVSPQSLHELSPVIITPKPKNLIRVTLYFQPLKTRQPVTAPLLLPVNRDGFTAVEWGGIFKQDKEHPFTCFM